MHYKIRLFTLSLHFKNPGCPHFTGEIWTNCLPNDSGTPFCIVPHINAVFGNLTGFCNGFRRAWLTVQVKGDSLILVILKLSFQHFAGHLFFLCPCRILRNIPSFLFIFLENTIHGIWEKIRRPGLLFILYLWELLCTAAAGTPHEKTGNDINRNHSYNCWVYAGQWLPSQNHRPDIISCVLLYVVLPRISSFFSTLSNFFRFVSIFFINRKIEFLYIL